MADKKLRALLVFHNPEDARYKRILKYGFWHVFAALEVEPTHEGNERMWITVDGVDMQFATQVVAPASYDLAGWYREQGLTVLETYRGAEPDLRWFVLANCVGLVKRLANLHAPFWVITPYQLFRYISAREKKRSIS